MDSLEALTRLAGGASDAASFADGFFHRHPGLKRFAPRRTLDKHGGAGGHPEARQSGDDVWLFPKFWKLPPDIQDFVYIHELGHLVKSNFGGSAFMRAAERLGVDPWDTSNLPFGQFNMDEAFADCFATHFLDPSDLKRRYPAWGALVRVVAGL